MAPRAAPAAAALLLSAALLCLALAGRPVEALNVNGGKSCRYVTPRMAALMLAERGVADSAAMRQAAALDSLKTVDGWLCKTCLATRGTEARNSGALVDGYSECWCKPGFGAFTLPPDAKGRVIRGFGCSPCPHGKTTFPIAGPFDTVKKTWTGTPCV
ncbi:hypothetical protein Rsub_02657 [Raphidocelis subcapitata]|uniref:Uncharacterized protein n=1 Tax=Raphidocelis subcapitata TaxID=307507 RepID=A0A2V0NWL2_9CHLO|nr:hypothetical protein Rsub_02657 [Raphidocelis subcapitata]|eukprot:GBF89953.1 hypothetical protein Rsub_02657 [Raphidocelis subcapitata]